MKTLKYILSTVLLITMVWSCTEDEFSNTDFLNSAVAPTNITADFDISHDNSGLVKITPKSEGAVSYTITFGDETAEPVSIESGKNIEHIYAEGEYNVNILASGITGLTTESIEVLPVWFRAPEDLEVTPVVDSSNPFIIKVKATAKYAASFNVFFDTSDIDEVATPLSINGEVSHEYPSVGEFTIKVVALSGGVETIETTEVITISAPTQLPIDFEIIDTNSLIDFGGAVITVIDNPKNDEANSSAKVAQIVKNAGETWAGNVIQTSAPIDFSTKKLIKMDVWSPRPGGQIIMKLENIDDANINKEVVVTTVGNSAWEEVVFDFSDIDMSNTYQKIVLFFDFGTIGAGGSDWTFYIDNIKQDFLSEGSFAKLMVEDFESTPELLPFGNASAEVITLNDLPSGLGIVTDNVAQFTKVNGAEVWAGVTRELDMTLDIATYSNISIKTWSPKTGAMVKVKLENADASIVYEVDMNTTISNTWEEIVYDFSGAPAADYVKVVIFFDFGVSGDDSVYYFDDYALTN